MKKNGFAPALILIVIAVLGIGGYLAFKNYSKQGTASTTQAPSRDASLENYLKDRLDACVEYPNENKCDRNENYALIQIINGDYAYGGFGNAQTGFQFGAVKKDGKWEISYTGGGGIPDCNEISIFPIGIFGEDILNICFDGKQTIVRTTGKSLNQNAN